MVPSSGSAESRRFARGSAEECSERAKRRERAAERVAHNGHRWVSGSRRIEKRALTGGTNRRGISGATRAQQGTPIPQLPSTGRRRGAHVLVASSPEECEEGRSG